MTSIPFTPCVVEAMHIQRRSRCDGDGRNCYCHGSHPTLSLFSRNLEKISASTTSPAHSAPLQLHLCRRRACVAIAWANASTQPYGHTPLAGNKLVPSRTPRTAVRSAPGIPPWESCANTRDDLEGIHHGFSVEC